jgi:hypothetical protein
MVTHPFSAKNRQLSSTNNLQDTFYKETKLFVASNPDKPPKITANGFSPE